MVDSFASFRQQNVGGRGNHYPLPQPEIGGRGISIPGGVVINNPTSTSEELLIAGQYFSLGLTSTSTGISAGNLVGATSGAVTQFVLWNPTTSTVNLIIEKVTVGVVSGTPPAGSLFHGAWVTASTLTASTGTAYNGFLGGASPQGMYIASAAGVTASGSSGPVVLRPMSLDFSATAFSDAAGTMVTEVVGDIAVPPGKGWLPLWNGSGTSVINSYGVVWREVAV